MLKKTKVPHFGKRKQNMTPFCMNGSILPVESKYEYLGIFVDNRLDFKDHFNEIQTTFSFNLYLYKRVKYFLNNFAAKQVLKSMVLSYLDYESMLLITRTIAAINDLQIMQNKALRTCLKVR